ncbi:ABC transporter ATP-binding protein [Culicoidibacter larvae]|uniref:ABC transporter ATP-binding protein n=1 Tax=Culicoidibacter larvae TaxID=2579976 RepID=A0A5R8QFI7_9FIRM|nr:ABC transporter ATP-binding protein [Culicoidibacter larvae]
MKLMWQYSKRYKGYIFLNFLCVFGFVLIELGLPTLLAKMIDDGINHNNFQIVLFYGLMMLVISLIGFVGLIFLAYFGSKISTSIVRDIRDDVFTRIHQFSHAEFDKFGVSSLITRTGNDAYQVMLFMQQVLRMGLISPIMFISSLVMIVITSPSLAWTIIVALPLLILGIVFIAIVSEPLSRAQQKSLDGINRILRENLSGLRVVRAFVKEKFQESRFNDVNDSYASVSKKLFKLMALAQPSFSLLFTVIMIAVVWFGVQLVGAGNLQIGNLVAFIDYIFHALFSFMLFASLFMLLPRALVSANRISEVLHTEPTISENLSGITKTTKRGYVTFENVTFAYPGNSEEPLLRDISFTAEPGQTVAFIGSTGSGKSTLIQLIPRFYDVTRGRILVDDVDVRDYKLSSLRDKIGFIPQKALLFTGTIADNLRHGKSDATLDELMRAADIAQAEDFISRKENQYDELLSEGGANMSGGQKQRLSIARALVKEPDIYIFDDSFSALDYKTDATLRARIKEELSDATILIVAQRVGTIMNADKIIVLNDGVIVAEGTHKELLKSSDIYYDIAASQLSKEELA